MPFGIISSGGNIVTANGGTGTVTKNTWAISRIRWVSKSASAGSSCVVKDAVGNIIFESNATGADWQDETDLSKVSPIAGVQITTLSDGDVSFYLR